MEAARTSETSVDNYFKWQYIPEDNSEHLIEKFNKAAEIKIIYYTCLIKYFNMI
jgi:hypothetical protein